MTDETEIQPDADTEIEEVADAPEGDAAADDSSDDTSDDTSDDDTSDDSGEDAPVAKPVVALPVDADGVPENGEWRVGNAHARFGFDERRVGKFRP